VALRRSKELVVAEPTPRALVASAANFKLDNQAWRSFRFGDVGWQTEVWRFYDIIPEFHFLADWVGRACSRCRLYIANVDDEQNVLDEVKNDATVSSILNGLLGSPQSKKEALRADATNLTVAGEVWTVGLAPQPGGEAKDEEWVVVSGIELRRWAGNVVLTREDGSKRALVEGQDLLIRIWNPHPRRMLWADAPSRSAMPILAELEKLQRYTFAQLDSRLAGAGVWMLPKGLDFPTDEGRPEGAPGLFQELMETASAGLSGTGTAASLVPILVEVDAETLANIKPPLTFASELSTALDEKKQLALQRLSWAMDTPPEVLKGHGDTNHWGSFNIDETTIKMVIEPIMNRICDGYWKAYVAPALKLAGKDPSKYTLTFSTSGLTVRPQRLQDTLNLHKEGIASEEAVLRAGDYPETDAMSPQEKAVIFLKELMIANPAFGTVIAMLRAVGVTAEMIPDDTDFGGVIPSDTPPANEMTQVAPHAELPVVPDVNKSKAKGAPAEPVGEHRHPQVLDRAKSIDVTPDKADQDRLQRWLESLDPDDLGYKM